VNPDSISWSGPDGAPLVALVHGAMDRGAGLARVARKLDAVARTVRYDRRGYGRNVDHPGPFTIAGNVDDLIEVLGERPAVLVGHSLGGDIVLATAERRPDLALGVVVFEPPMPWADWWPASSASSQAVADPAGAEHLPDPGRDARIAEQFMRRLVGDQRWDALPERTRQIRRSEGRALVGELADLRHEPWHGSAITCPVLVGVSDHPRPHHVRATAEIAASIAGAEVVELTGCHHDAHTSSPGQFAERLVLPMLERVTAA